MGLLLFQNEACLVINKLPGEDSETAGAGFAGSDGLRGGVTRDKLSAPGGKFPAPVHRLDTPVSGCLLLARNKKAAAFLGAAFAAGNAIISPDPHASSAESAAVNEADPLDPRASAAESAGERNAPEPAEKHYWAIVEKPAAEIPAGAELLHWLVTDKKLNKSFAYNGNEDKPPEKAKKARLRYRICGEGERYLFLEIDLLTGRHHQIRAQLAAMGLHVKGDLKYGARRSEKGGGIRLHAYSLAFPDPVNPGERVLVKALPPLLDPLWTAFCIEYSGKYGIMPLV